MGGCNDKKCLQGRSLYLSNAAALLVAAVAVAVLLLAAAVLITAVLFVEAVEQSVQVDLNSSQGYTVIFIQDGVSNTIKINGGGDSVIKITQGS